MIVYDGIATSIPTTPATLAAIRRSMKISSGCAFALFEKITGWKTKLSTNWVKRNTDIKVITSDPISAPTGNPVVNMIAVAKIAPIHGPI